MKALSNLQKEFQNYVFKRDWGMVRIIGAGLANCMKVPAEGFVEFRRAKKRVRS